MDEKNRIAFSIVGGLLAANMLLLAVQIASAEKGWGLRTDGTSEVAIEGFGTSSVEGESWAEGKVHFYGDVDFEDYNLTRVNDLSARSISSRSPLYIRTANVTRVMIDDSVTTFNHPIMLNHTGSPPTCDSSTRGMLWFDVGQALVADTVEVCMKSALNSYGWRTMSLA